MSSADFAAAQARLQARRLQREASLRARQSSLHSSRPSALSRLPFPFSTISNAGLSAWDTIKSREGSRPAFRVGQVDAELLDEELLDLMKGQVGEALKYFGGHLDTDWSSEILLALRAILFKLSLWDHDASYGAALQGLRYTDARQKSAARPVPQRWQKAVYGLVTVVGRYGWEKWEQHLVDLDGGYDEPSPMMQKLKRLTTVADTTHSVAALISFLTFLYNGTHRTLLDRMLRLRLVPKSSHTSREVSFEYLNRQLVWHAFTEFLLFLLPLVGISRWRRLASRVWRRIANWITRSKLDEDDERGTGGELGFLPERTCAICYADLNPTAGAGESEAVAASTGGGVVGSAQTDITNPYEAVPCGDVYCFICITQKIEAEEGEGWTCLRCGEVVKECKPWSGDVIEETSRPHSTSGGKSVGFADDVDEVARRQEKYIGEEEEEMHDVEPRPEDDDVTTTREAANFTSRPAFTTTDSFTRSLDDSGQWARESTLVNGDAGTTTEEHTEDEEYTDSHSEQSDEDEDDLITDGDDL